MFAQHLEALRTSVPATWWRSIASRSWRRRWRGNLESDLCFALENLATGEKLDRPPETASACWIAHTSRQAHHASCALPESPLQPDGGLCLPLTSMSQTSRGCPGQ